MFENVRRIELPNSRLLVQIAICARLDVDSDDSHRAIQPAVLIELTSADYFSGTRIHSYIVK
jgi:hypothetical protein